MIRFFDFIFSLIALLILSPFFLIIALLISFNSKGGVFFKQRRVGLNNVEFKILKFRTMNPDSESKGQLTIGASDSRVTSIGKTLRRYKLDELPQLWNVLVSEMSLVGPRPEVPKYVAHYTDAQKVVLSVKPGMTDLASLAYFDEDETLAKSEHPEQTYIQEILPKKIELNMRFIKERSLKLYFSILAATIKRMLQ